MSEPRFIHRTAKLHDGRVLLTGGARAIWAITDTVDIYDPAANTITPAAPMSIKRWSHAAVTLSDGRVLVCGGRTGLSEAFPPTHPFFGELLTSAEIYDPATDTWTPTGSMNVARRSHTATLLPDGTVFIVGGGDRVSTGAQIAIASCEMYDPTTSTFTIVGDMIDPRTAALVEFLDDGTVFIGGGSTFLSTRYPTDKAEIYDPADNSFTAIGPMVSSRLAQAIEKLRDGKLLLAGGYFNPNHTPTATVTADAEIYDPVTQTFTAVAPMVKQRIDIGGQLLLDGSVLIAGGASTSPQQLYPTIFNSSSEVYFPKSGKWRLTGVMADGRDEFSGLVLDDGRALITGGFTRDPNSRLLDSTEVYTPGLAAQVNGLLNVINDLPETALADGDYSREVLLDEIEKIGHKLAVDSDDDSDDDSAGACVDTVFNHNVPKEGFGAVFCHRDGLHTARGCFVCHGEDLKGGEGAFAGPSCYTCHGQEWDIPDDPKLAQAFKKTNKLVDAINDEITDPDEKQRVLAIVQVLINTINRGLATNIPPTVTVTAVPTSGTEPLEVAFTATASDPDGQILSYSWDFGDASLASGPNPTHTYTCDGTFTAVVRVLDDGGDFTEASIDITIASAGGPLTYDCDVQPVFNTWCIGCHGSSGGVNLQGCQNTQNSNVVVPGNKAASLLYTEIASGDMPPTAVVVPPADITRIGDWIDTLDQFDPDFCD
jgi:hypothetical protein